MLIPLVKIDKYSIIEDVINNLKLQGFKVNYSFENKENGCKITIDID